MVVKVKENYGIRSYRQNQISKWHAIMQKRQPFVETQNEADAELMEKMMTVAACLVNSFSASE